MRSIQILVSLLSILLIAACSNTVKPNEVPQVYISSVTVSSNSLAEINPSVVAGAELGAKKVASAYSREIPPGVPTRQLHVRIDNVHYKGAVASLIVGDTNRVSARVGVVNDNGTPERTGEITYVDIQSGAVNGIVGAAIAASGDKAKIDAKLATGLGEQAVNYLYGQKTTPDFVRNILLGKSKGRYPPYIPQSRPAPVSNETVPAV